jgi:riboflavin synthase
MFTGIVETKGRVEALRARADGGRRLVVSTSLDLSAVPLGGSIAVQGVCLTLVARRGRRFEADLGPETLARTTLGALRPGDSVHLERPLRLGDPLGGHLVAGHVDGVGRVKAARRAGEALDLTIAAPADLAPFLAPKGSVALDGVSLTVNTVTGADFAVTLIPHTLAVTGLGRLRPGDRVNVEADLLAKQLARLLESRLAALSAPRPGRSRRVA